MRGYQPFCRIWAKSSTLRVLVLVLLILRTANHTYTSGIYSGTEVCTVGYNRKMPCRTITLGWYDITPPRTIFDTDFLDIGEGVLNTPSDASIMEIYRRYISNATIFVCVPPPPVAIQVYGEKSAQKLVPAGVVSCHPCEPVLTSCSFRLFAYRPPLPTPTPLPPPPPPIRIESADSEVCTVAET